jgi:hypothetical protein
MINSFIDYFRNHLNVYTAKPLVEISMRNSIKLDSVKFNLEGEVEEKRSSLK